MMISGGGPAFTDKRPIEDYTVGSGTAFGAELRNQIDSSLLADVARRGKISLERQAREDAMRRAKPIHKASTFYDAETARQKVKDAGVDYTIPDEGVQVDEFETMLELRKRQRREEITVSRRPKTWLGAGAVLAGDFTAGLVDPINVAASYIPIVGQLRYARWLERAGSAGGRAAVRLGVGAAEGTVGAAAYEGLNLAFNRSLPENYGLADSFLNIAFGGVLGGGLHAVGGLGRDLIYGVEPYRPSSVATQTALHRAVVDADAGRTVDVSPIVDGAALDGAVGEIGRFRRHLSKIDAEEARALDAGVRGERTAERGSVQERIQTLTAEVARLGEEIQGALAKAAAAVDDVTPSRLAAISRELSGDISAKRRANLEAEQRMLTDGRAQSPEQEARARDSYLAEAKGLETAQTRAKRDLRRAQESAGKLEQGKTAVERALDQAAGRITSRRGDVMALTTRAVRRWAATVGQALDADAARAIAERLMTTPVADMDAVIRSELGALGGEKITRAAVAPDVYDPATKAEPREMADLRAQADEALALGDAGADLDGEIEALGGYLDMARKREALSAADEAALSLADEFEATAKRSGDAYRAAAACLSGLA